jgi:hypothetical protein
MAIFLGSTSHVMVILHFKLENSYSNFLSQLPLNPSVILSPMCLQMSPVSTCCKSIIHSHWGKLVSTVNVEEEEISQS